MAQFEKHFVQDLTQDIKIRQCGTIVFNADNLSNVVSIALYNGEKAYTGGGTVVGAVVCPDGATVALDGTLSGNVASITLTGDCFALQGQIGVSIQIVSGDVRTTVLKAIYNVDVSSTDTIVDPGSRITLSLAEIEAKLDEIPTILANAQTAIDGIEAQKDTMIASIASVAGQGTDTTLTQSGVAADAKATGDQVRDLKSAVTSVENGLVYHKSRNLFDEDAVINNKYVTAQGVITDTPTPGESAVSDYIYVHGLSSIVFSWEVRAKIGQMGGKKTITRMVFYDKNKAFVSTTSNWVNTATVPENAYYVVLSINAYSNAYFYQLESGTQNTILTEYYAPYYSQWEECPYALGGYTKAELVSFLDNIPGADFIIGLQTDTHYSFGNGYSAVLNAAKAISAMTWLGKNISCIANLGDLVNGAVALPSQKSDIVEMMAAYSSADCEYLQLVGNHDDNTWYTRSISEHIKKSECETALDWYFDVVTKLKSISGAPYKRYFSKDFVDEKIRIICLDTLDIDYDWKKDNGQDLRWYGQWCIAIRQDQINWLIECLKLPENWSVIVLSHHCLADGENYANAPMYNSNLVRGVLEAFKTGGTFSGTGSGTGVDSPNFDASVDVDFTSQGARPVIGCFAGHNHADALYTINGINYVQMINTYNGNSTDFACVDKTGKRVTLKRFGTGSDRSFAYT